MFNMKYGPDVRDVREYNVTDVDTSVSTYQHSEHTAVVMTAVVLFMCECLQLCVSCL